MAMKDHRFPIEKISDNKLLQLAHTDRDEPECVIIELDLPEPKVEFHETQRGGIKSPAPIRVVPETSEEGEEIERRINEAKHFLDDILETPAKWLGAAHAFIADAKPSQIREIARFSLTKAIRPSRTLKGSLEKARQE